MTWMIFALAWLWAVGLFAILFFARQAKLVRSGEDWLFVVWPIVIPLAILVGVVLATTPNVFRKKKRA